MYVFFEDLNYIFMCEIFLVPGAKDLKLGVCMFFLWDEDRYFLKDRVTVWILEF